MLAHGNLFLLTNQWWFGEAGGLGDFFFLLGACFWFILICGKPGDIKLRNPSITAPNSSFLSLLSSFLMLFLFFLWLIISAWNILYLPLSPDATVFSLKVHLRCLGFIQFSRILLSSNNLSHSDLLWPFVFSYGSYGMCVVCVCVLCVCVVSVWFVCGVCVFCVCYMC